MSTAYSSAKQQYIGNGVTTEWGFDFPIKKHSELKVYLKRSGMTQVLLEEGVDYSFVTDNTITFPIKTGEAKLQASDVLALQRESVFESEYNFSNQQRLEPEEVMHADDNLERQIQELKRDVTQAIRIQPTSNINTDEYFIAVESIYENLDNITNVSGISAEIVNCSDNISDISTVSSDIANVNAVGQSISNVNTVASNVSSVNTVAGVSTDVTTVAGIASSVHTVANNSANVTTVATNISDVNTAASNMAAIQAAPTAATNAAQSATNAANSATDSANSATDSANSATASATSANNSHIWAEGTDAQVAALGGVHSSKGWAQQSTNANIALTNSPYTTNRILEIPQNIKLELNNGTLTLKAGSKVYVPNGFESDGTTQKFDVRIIENDVTYTQGGTLPSVPTKFIAVMNFAATAIGAFSLSICSSGSGVVGNNTLHYRTDTNYLVRTTSAGIASNMTFPLAILTVDSTGISSIDQVFNGFGYIGSTVFALPGIKVQIPNGRNADGTCKTSIFTKTNVMAQTVTDSGDFWFDVFVAESQTYCLRDPGKIHYDPEENLNVDTAGNGRFVIGQAHFQGGKCVGILQKTVDSVANSNASNFSQAGRSYLSGLGMPSNRYINLTLGASGSTYTAPANGWFTATANPTSANGFVAFYRTDNYIGSGTIVVPDTTYKDTRASVCCSKGKSVRFHYGRMDIISLRFYYAEGEQNV